MSILKKSALSLAITSSLFLGACSGGSGSSTDGGNSNSATTQTVSGEAVKGVMKFATVTAYALDSKGVRTLQVVGSTETDEEGEYSLDLADSYQGGPIEIVVSVNDRTRMICDASACGTKGADVELPANFELSAITDTASGDEAISTPVTAWSTMAASRTKTLAGQGKSLEAASQQAYAEVNQVAGFDVAKTRARDVNNLDGASASEAQAAVMNAVVAELIYAGGDVSENLANFAKALDDGTVGDDKDSFSVSQLADATRQVTDSTPELDSDTKDALNTQTAQYDNAEDGLKPTYDEELAIGADSTQAEKIAAFKKFVSQARTWVASVEELDSDQLGAAIQVDVDTIQAALGEGPLNSLQMSMDIIGQSLELITLDPADIQTAMENGESREMDILDNEVKVGTATLSFANDNGLVVTLTGAITGEAATAFLPFDLTLATNLPVDALDLSTGVISRILSSNVMTLNGSVDDGTGSKVLILENVEAQLNLAKDLADTSTEQLNANFQNASLKGGVTLAASTGDSFSGQLEARLTRLTSNQVLLNETPVSFERLRLAGEFQSADGNRFRSSATLNINNAASFDTFAWADYNDQSIDVDTNVDGSNLAPLLDLLPEGTVLPDAGVESWTHEGGTRDAWFYAGGYEGDGSTKYHYASLDGTQISVVAEAIRDAIVAQLPETLTFTGYNDNTGEEETFSLTTSDALSSGPVSANVWADPEFGSVYLDIYPDIALLPDGISDAWVSTGLAEGDYISLNNYDLETLNVSFESPAFVTDSQAAAELAMSGLGLADAQVNSAYVTEFDPWGGEPFGYIDFTRAAELGYYENCLADPEGQLPLLGNGWYDPTWDDADWACADATLSYSYESGELDADTLASIDGLVFDALSGEFGSFASQLSLNGYYLNSYGYLYVDAQTPDLETADNFINASFTLTAGVDMPELPAANVTATASRKSYRGGSLLANVKWNDGQYSLVVASDDLANPETVTARIFNPQGYELTLNGQFDASGNFTGVTGDALLNGEDIGDVETRNGIPMITYPNGDVTEFESLF